MSPNRTSYWSLHQYTRITNTHVHKYWEWRQTDTYDRLGQTQTQRVKESCRIFKNGSAFIEVGISVKCPLEAGGVMAGGSWDCHHKEVRRHIDTRLCLLNVWTEDVCESGIDLHVMIDQSRSIPKPVLETAVRRFLPAFLGKFNIDKKGTRVTFSLHSRRSKFELVNIFKQSTSYKKKDLKKLLLDIPTDERYFTTRIQHGLKEVHKEVFTKRSGARKAKQKVLLILGDGNSHPSTSLTKMATKLRVSDFATRALPRKKYILHTF